MKPDLDVLTRSQAKLPLARWQFEGVSARVVGDVAAADQLDGYPTVLLQGELAAVVTS